MIKTLCFSLILTLLLCACESSELHESMEEMGDSFKSMRESDDLAAIKKDYAAFKSALEITKAQKIGPDDQSTFDEGMQELVELVKQIDAALTANDLEGTKALFEQLGKSRKKYHKKLDVK